jgi:NitT/TauT family transport system substrate-binding protein
MGSRFSRSLRRFSIVGLLGLTVAACSSGSAASDKKLTVRLGYFPNITHATAIAGVEKGIFARTLGSNVTLKTQIYNAGPDEVTALFADGLDLAYMGPNPAINAYSKSNGEAIRIISGATSGGAYLVVNPSITSPSDLKSKKIAAPQLGNTQDVALRSWLDSQGLKTTTSGGGDVQVIDQENSQTLDTFKSGDVDGAWVPEPWASRLVVEGGGKVLVDEGTLWPDGKYVTTQLVVRTAFLQQHPDVVENFLRGQIESTKYVNQNRTEAKQVVGSAISSITGKSLKPEVIDRAWANLTFTNDPIGSSLRTSAQSAAKLGFIQNVDLSGIYDLTLLNKVLTNLGEKQISSG